LADEFVLDAHCESALRRRRDDRRQERRLGHHGADAPAQARPPALIAVEDRLGSHVAGILADELALAARLGRGDQVDLVIGSDEAGERGRGIVDHDQRIGTDQGRSRYQLLHVMEGAGEDVLEVDVVRIQVQQVDERKFGRRCIGQASQETDAVAGMHPHA